MTNIERGRLSWRQFRSLRCTQPSPHRSTPQESAKLYHAPTRRTHFWTRSRRFELLHDSAPDAWCFVSQSEELPPCLLEFELLGRIQFSDDAVGRQGNSWHFVRMRRRAIRGSLRKEAGEAKRRKVKVSAFSCFRRKSTSPPTSRPLDESLSVHLD